MVARFLSMNLHRAFLLGQRVDRAEGQGSGFIQCDFEIIWSIFANLPSFDLLNTSEKLWYSSGMLFMLTGFSEVVVDRPVTSGCET